MANDFHSNESPAVSGEPIDDILWTEEDLKAKVIVPWLSDIGLQASDLTLERVQMIQAGRQIISVRHDFLARRFGRPLMFIETKRLGHELNDSDRAQARLYALLHEPIAPMAMLTNGADTEVYDSLTNKRIDGAIVAADHPYFQDGYEFDPGTDIRLRTEAIAQYVALSAENLRRFSSSQRDYRASHLVGGAQDDVDKRVLPSLYVASGELDLHWKSFLVSEDRVFVVLGEPGIGKTNSLWAFSEEHNDSRLAFFLDAGRLTDGLWAALRDDFGWAFTAEMSKEVLVRSLRQVSSEANCEIFIFVDAVDENGRDYFPAELDDFCHRLADHGVRVVLSCRRWDWRRFARIHDAPTWVGQEARVRALSPFTPDEFEEAWPRYVARFEIDTLTISKVVAEICRDRFTLRVLCEVYSGGQVPDRIDVPELLSAFVARKIGKSEDPPTMDACLVALGRWMLERGSHTIESDQLLALPGLTPTARDALLGCELLAAAPDGRYRFASGQVHNLFVALRAGGWSNMPVNDFGDEAERAFSSAAGQQAMSWFWQHFPEYHKAIAQTMQGRALAFITQRNGLIERWVPGLRPALDPRIEGDAAIILQVDDDEQIYGNWKLCPRDPDGPLVVFERTADFMRKPHGTIHIATGIDSDDAKRLLVDEIEEQLGGGLRSTGLRERAPFLPVEKLVDELLYAEAAPFAEELGLAAVNPVAGGIYGGSFTRHQLTEGIKFWSARWFAQQEVIRKKLERGEAIVTIRDGISTTSYNLTDADRAELGNLAAAMVVGGDLIPVPSVVGDVPQIPRLNELLGLTKSDEFTSTIPEPDVQLTHGGSIESCFSPDLKATFIQEFFELALPALRESAELLFAPALREIAPLLLQPLAAVWALDWQNEQLLGGTFLTFVIGRSPTAEDLVAEASAPIDITSEEPFQIAGKAFTATYRTETYFSSLLMSGEQRRGWRSAAPTPLFDWVLDELERRLPRSAFLSLFEGPSSNG